MNSKLFLFVIVGITVVSLSVYGITLLNEKDTPSKFENTHNFQRDEVGQYEKWCNENNGHWNKIEFICGFMNEEESIKARADLDSRKKVQIDEIYSSIICDKMQMQCPDNPQFDGNFSMDSGRTHVTAHKKGLDGSFYFDASDPDILHFRTCATEEYDNYEDECKWQSLSVENELLYRIYSERYQGFESSMGFSNNFNGTILETWCVGNNGMWEKSENTCFFVTDADYELADIALSRPHISQEKTQAICKFLEMDCPSHASFNGSFSVVTGQTIVTYEYKKTQYQFDVTDDTIKYRLDRDSDWANIDSVSKKESQLSEDNVTDTKTELKLVKETYDPTSPDEVIKSMTLHDVPYQELIENEQEYLGKFLYYQGKISNSNEYHSSAYAAKIAKIAVTQGADWVDFIELSYNGVTLKEDSLKKVWGMYNGINDETGLPMLQVFIIE